MKFLKFLNEGNTSNATNMELAIVQTNNGQPLKHPTYGDNAQNIVKFLEVNGIKGEGKHMGSGNWPLTEFWIKHGGSNATPKTDLMIGDARISLKKEGGSQLMSGKEGESRATFYAALENVNFDTKSVINEVEGFFYKFVDSKDPLNITQQKKTKVASKEVLDAEIMHKKFTKYLTNQFKNNTSFEDAFIYESMSGMIKFGDSYATDSHILVFDQENGIKNQLLLCNDPSYIRSKSKTTKVGVSWKSTSSTTKKSGKVYSFFSVIRLLSEELNNELGQYPKLNEGIVSSVMKNITKFFKSIWKRIKKWLFESMENVLNFFDLKPIVSPVVITF